MRTNAVLSGLAVVVVATALFLGSAVPASANSSSSTDKQGAENGDSVRGWKHRFTEEDGLILETGSIDLSPEPAVQKTSTYAASSVVVTGSKSTTFQVNRGSSYAKSYHPFPLHLRYFGSAHAKANLYSGNYVVSAAFRYYREAGFNSGWKSSNATQSSNCKWTTGQLKEYSVFDSLLGGDENITRFAYSFKLLPPTLC